MTWGAFMFLVAYFTNRGDADPVTVIKFYFKGDN